MIVLSMFYKHNEGGFNKRLYRMYHALAKHGHEVHYLSCEKFPIENRRVHFHEIPMPVRNRQGLLFWFLFIIIAPLWAYRVSRVIRPDRIAVFGSWYAVFMVLPRIFSKCRIVLFLRADSVEVNRIERRPLPARAINYILQYIGTKISDKIICNIELVRANIIKRFNMPKTKFSILYNNIDAVEKADRASLNRVRNELGIKTGEVAIITSGIFYRRKNIDFLIRAFAKAFTKNNARLVIIGDDVGQGSERRMLEDLVLSLGKSDCVAFTGWRNDSKRLIGACDIYVLPTLHEGFPNSLLDALGVGCPRLGSRIREVEEILHYDDLLFSLTSHEELAAKLKRFSEDVEYREHIRQLTIKRAETCKFDWDRAVVDAVTG